MDDFKKITYGVLIGFATLMVVWLLFIFFNACGLDPSCKQAAAPLDVTPIPTVSVAHVSSAPNTAGAGEFNKCQVRALDLLGAWVDAGSPESDAFPFTDLKGTPCQATFADVMPLLGESQLWFHASLSCTSCHNGAFKEGMGGLDLTSYAGILAGSQRASADVAKGNDILGGGSWQNSTLFKSLTLTENVPVGHPTADQANALVVYAGAPVPPPTATPAP